MAESTAARSDSVTGTDSRPAHSDSECHEQVSNSQLMSQNKELMTMLTAMNDNLNRKLDSVVETVEVLKGDIFDLQQSNDRLTADLVKCQEKQKETERKLEEALYFSKLSYERSNDNEQYSRRNNVKFLHVEEAETTYETSEESEEKVLKVVNEKLGLQNIKAEHIDVAHRIGKKKAGETRPIMVKFLSRKSRDQVIQNRRKLKNKQVVIVEDLTKNNYILLRLVADHPGIERAWSSGGNIFGQVTATKKVLRVKNPSDLRFVQENSFPPADMSAITTSTPKQDHPHGE